MKKNSQQRLILNIIIFVIAAFILLFVVLGKFLSSSNETTYTPTSKNKLQVESQATQNELLSRERNHARIT